MVPRSPVPEEPIPLEVGGTLGRFNLLGRLGVGGMGEIFRARDTRLDRDVAIKVIARHLQGHSEPMVRFEREAQAVSALNHPNIVTIFDIGEHKGFPYIVMELVEGDSLRTLVQGGPLPLEQVLAIAIQIARGLSAAHGQGIVHRDLKPENILVSIGNQIKLLDFGLAQLVSSPLRDNEQFPTQVKLTGDGSILGTLGYMAPEIISGTSSDHRVDQFSLGVILFEMLSGKRPFRGSSTAEVIASTLRDAPPDLSSAEVPGPVEHLVLRCLRKDPEERYESVREIVAILETVSESAARTDTESGGHRSIRGGLPSALTPLIGRSREIEQVESLLQDAAVRLVTIAGAGGCGKTRLALQVGENLQQRSMYRVIFVPLAPVRDPELVPLAIARELGVRPGPNQTELDAVRAECSAGETTLLLLDNFEHLMAAAPLVGELLVSCPRLKILVTSREVLRVYGEHHFELPPLETPPSGLDATLEELERIPSVALFVRRARAAEPGFTLDSTNASAVAELCRRLEGLPLALELAAASSRMMSPSAILARLGTRLELRGALRDRPGRQQTLRSTMDWSYELLDETEQAVFRRLGVFAGGFGLEPAQAVADPFGKLDLDIVEGISSLMDKSLVTALGGEAGRERFGMLETVREYALERLAASGEMEPTLKAHAAYYLILAEEGGAALAHAEDANWIGRFEEEHDNYRGALGWLTERGHADWGLRMALGLFHFWERAEHLTEGRRRFKELLGLTGEDVGEGTRARALFCAAVLAGTQGYEDEARALDLQCLQIYRELGDLWGQAVVLNALGAHPDPPFAREKAEEALALWTRLGDRTGYARSLCNLAMALRRTGQYEEARSAYQEAAEVFDGEGDEVSRAWALNHAGNLAVERRDFEAAEVLYRDAMETFQKLAEPWGIASSLADLGTLERRRGNREAARSLYRQSLVRFDELGHRRGVARLLESLACLSVEFEEAKRALTLAEAAAALRERIGAPLTAEERRELDLELEAARRSLPRKHSEAAIALGRRLLLGQVMAEALGDQVAQP